MRVNDVFHGIKTEYKKELLALEIIGCNRIQLNLLRECLQDKLITSPDRKRYFIKPKHRNEFYWYTTPIQIRNRMLMNQFDQCGISNPGPFITDMEATSEDDGFFWEDTPEGLDFWIDAIQRRKYHVTEDNWRIILETSTFYLIWDDLSTKEFKTIMK